MVRFPWVSFTVPLVSACYAVVMFHDWWLRALGGLNVVGCLLIVILYFVARARSRQR